MLTLDNVLSPLLQQLGVTVFEEHKLIPPSVNHAIRNYSNMHCAEHVQSFCSKSEISTELLFERVGYPASLLIKQHRQKLFELIMLRGVTLTIDDNCVQECMSWIIDDFQMIQHSLAAKRIFVDNIEVIDCLEYFSIIDDRPIERVDGLSLTKDIGFMTALSIRQYIETGQRYYLLPALPNIIENEDLKLSTVLRFVQENEFAKLPLHLANLILSVENTDYVDVGKTLEELVGQTWPIDYHRFNLLLDITPVCSNIKSTPKIASNLAINPVKKTTIPKERMDR